MEASLRAGRIIGTLILLQMAGGFVINFVLEAPLFGSPGFLVNAAAHAQQIGLAAVLGLVMEAFWVGIAVTAFPILFARTRALTLWLFAFAVVNLAVAVLESAGVMSMVSMSEAYAQATPIEHEQLQAARVIVASTRNWAHFLGRMSDGCTIFVFYAVLFRFTLVPRAIAGFGLVAATLLVVGVGMPLFGQDVIFPLLAPLGLSQLALAAWLLVKGFRAEEAAGARSA